MTDQTADNRRGTTPADPGTNLTNQSLTDDDRTALYPTVPADPPAVDLIDRHLLAAADYHAPPATRRDDARTLYAALAADAPYAAGDAPSLSRPLPTHEDPTQLRQQLDNAHTTIDALTAERDDARAAHRTASDAADRLRDVLADALGHPDNNPGDDTLIAELRAHFGRTGPEPTRWRDALTGYRASIDQINADQATPGSSPARAQGHDGGRTT